MWSRQKAVALASVARVVHKLLIPYPGAVSDFTFLLPYT